RRAAARAPARARLSPDRRARSRALGRHERAAIVTHPRGGPGCRELRAALPAPPEPSGAAHRDPLHLARPPRSATTVAPHPGANPAGGDGGRPALDAPAGGG